MGSVDTHKIGFLFSFHFNSVFSAFLSKKIHFLLLLLLFFYNCCCRWYFSWRTHPKAGCIALHFQFGPNAPARMFIPSYAVVGMYIYIWDAFMVAVCRNVQRIAYGQEKNTCCRQSKIRKSKIQLSLDAYAAALFICYFFLCLCLRQTLAHWLACYAHIYLTNYNAKANTNCNKKLTKFCKMCAEKTCARA